MHPRAVTFLTACLTIAGALALTASAYIHQKAGPFDFYAYYKAAIRFLAGQPFYVDEQHYAYKYAPITIFYFLPFTAFSLSAARTVFTAIQLGCVLSVPFLLSKLLRTPPLGSATFFAFLASCRFLDGEFRAGNCGIFILFGTLLAALCARSPRFNRYAPTLLGLSVVVKVHALVSFWTFRWEKDRKTLLAVAATLLLLLLVPSPMLWPAWVTQLKETGKYVVFRDLDLNLQGFYAFGSRFLGWGPNSHKSLLLALPFGIVSLWKFPRFTLQEARADAALFFHTLSCWILWALLSSPLPWQHTYSVLWIFFPVAWHYASRGEKLVLAAVATLIGVTAVDIVGWKFARAFEGNQGVFFCVLTFWIVGLKQLSRVRKPASQ